MLLIQPLAAITLNVSMSMSSNGIWEMVSASLKYPGGGVPACAIWGKRATAIPQYHMQFMDTVSSRSRNSFYKYFIVSVIKLNAAMAVMTKTLIFDEWTTNKKKSSLLLYCFRLRMIWLTNLHANVPFKIIKFVQYSNAFGTQCGAIK